MNIDEMTLADLKKLMVIFGSDNNDKKNGLSSMIGKKCIVRTYSAGVWFGEIAEKSGNEVVLKNARRMWRWWAAESISLSGVANFGIKQDKSQIAPAVDKVWLEAIELIPATDVAITSIEGAKNASAR